MTEQTTLNFDIDLFYSCSLEFSDNNGAVFTSYILGYGDDEPTEVETRLERLIDESIEVNKFEGNYNQLHCLAHELDRCSERLRQTANHLEDSTQIEDLFDIDTDDLPEVDDDSTTYKSPRD